MSFVYLIFFNTSGVSKNYAQYISGFGTPNMVLLLRIDSFWDVLIFFFEFKHKHSTHWNFSNLYWSSNHIFLILEMDLWLVISFIISKCWRRRTHCLQYTGKKQTVIDWSNSSFNISEKELDFHLSFCVFSPFWSIW